MLGRDGSQQTRRASGSAIGRAAMTLLAITFGTVISALIIWYLLTDPECLSRERYVDLVAQHSRPKAVEDRRRELASSWFDERHGEGSKHFNADVAREDRAKLVRLSRDVKVHVDKLNRPSG